MESVVPDAAASFVPSPVIGVALPFPTFTDSELRVLHEVQFPDLSQEEFAWVMAQCRARGINPCGNHVYIRKQWNEGRGEQEILLLLKIDGFRAVAADSGLYLGTEGPLWCGPDLNWKEIWTDDQAPPYAAKIGIRRKGVDKPIWRSVKWTEFAQFDDRGELLEHWRKMPSHILGLRAEASGFRAAFPERLGGVYTPDEIQDRPPRPPAGPDRGRKENAPVVAARSELPTIDADGGEPITLMQLELALLDLGYRDATERQRIIAHCRQRNPLMAANNPPAFYGWVLKVTPAKSRQDDELDVG